MKPQAIAALGVLFAGAAPAMAGPCTQQIATVQANFDVRLKQVAAIGPTADETTSAKLHHQPTAASVAGAEQQADMMSLEKQKAFQAAIDHARAADKAGNAEACEKDVATAKATMAP